MANWEKGRYFKVQTQVDSKMWNRIQNESGGKVAVWLRDLLYDHFAHPTDVRDDTSTEVIKK